MIEINNRIGIVTPLKNEIANLPELISKIAEQSIPVEYWVIIENGSDDGSKEYLANLQPPANVKNFVVINFTLPNERYELGHKYATVVNQGFEYFRKNNILANLDFVGILDADCFPGPTYYQELVDFMNKDPKLGISSGIAYTVDGQYDGKSKSWVRGNCRLWKIKCFLEAGYIIGPSADTLSVGSAEMHNWKAYSDQNLIYHCREVGNKIDYAYYGYSAYFRGMTPLYIIIRCLNYFLIGKPNNAKRYYTGYFDAKKEKKEQIQDKEMYLYFTGSLKRKITRLLG
jgi:glycosyltransferase involved in cell wall biosynthesis